jgi:hypothetical protein
MASPTTSSPSMSWHLTSCERRDLEGHSTWGCATDVDHPVAVGCARCLLTVGFPVCSPCVEACKPVSSLLWHCTILELDSALHL